MRDQLTAQRVRELLDYDPKTGAFKWRKNRRGVSALETVGTVIADGYLRITVDRHKYLAHRLAWLFVFGQWPDGEIDHINRNPGDNRIANLREATPSENKQNSRTYRNSSSGFRGVSYCKARRCWHARIKVNNKRRFVGSFDTPDAAFDAYCEAAGVVHTRNPFAKGIKP